MGSRGMAATLIVKCAEISCTTYKTAFGIVIFFHYFFLLFIWFLPPLFHLELSSIFHYSILGQTADKVVRGLHIRVSSWVPSSMDLTPNVWHLFIVIPLQLKLPHGQLLTKNTKKAAVITIAVCPIFSMTHS